jgi:hypothetical protein
MKKIMNTKVALDVFDCEISQLEATVYTLKRCLGNLRENIAAGDARKMEKE